MLHINQLTYRIAGRTLFEGATVAIPQGRRSGLVGRNGTGKTTLFNLIEGRLSPDGGALMVRPGIRLGRVSQQTPEGPSPLLDFVLAADGERQALLEQAEHAQDPQVIAETHERLAVIEAHSAPARAARILAGLGFDEAAQQRPLSSFSGGWRMRVALAATLFVRPDLLLLDEPTNHLDLEATLWLEGYLREFPGTLLLISHDRRLLNGVVEEVVHLEGGKLTRYVGNYDRFERTRSERLALDLKARGRQEAERRRIQAFVDRFRYKATKARQAQSRLKMLSRMEPIAAAVAAETVSFRFPEPDDLSPPLVSLEKVEIGYDDHPPVLSDVAMRIDMDDRIALLGANGNGKSTLMKVLADRLKVRQGSLRKSSRLRIGYFAQHQEDELNLEGTPLSHMAALMPLEPETRIRAHLGGFGFGADKAETRVGDLSGGEKARLLFALMSRHSPHLMLLDEPTNHLDVDARQALIKALNDYPGAVVLVSHDPHVVELVCDRLWLVDNGQCTVFEGDLDDYRRLLQEQRRGQRGGAATTSDSGNATPSRRQSRQNRAQRRAELAPLRQAARRAEQALERLHASQDRLNQQLAAPELYDGSPERVTELQIEMAQITRQLEQAEHQWLEIHEQLERANDADS